MNREQYLAKSKKMDLPPRCPLIGICDRWAQTIFFYQYYDSNAYRDRQIDYIKKLENDGTISADFNNNKIDTKAELPEFLRTNERVSYRNMCPEINLFDSVNCLSFAENTASVSGEFDSDNEKYNKTGFQNYNEKHYSECLEFSQFIFSQLDKKKISKFYTERQKRRTPISTSLRFEIFQRDKFTCQYCGRGIHDGVKLEIDHIIPVAEGGKDEFNNLRTACNECNNGKRNKII